MCRSLTVGDLQSGRGTIAVHVAGILRSPRRADKARPRPGSRPPPRGRAPRRCWCEASTMSQESAVVRATASPCTSPSSKRRARRRPCAGGRRELQPHRRLRRRSPAGARASSATPAASPRPTARSPPGDPARRASTSRLPPEAIDLVVDRESAGWRRRRCLRALRRPARCARSRSGSEASTTCSRRSASRASISVERNAATVRAAGRARNRRCRRATRSGVCAQAQPAHGRVERREQLVGDVGVAPVSELNSVDLPAFV